MELLPLAQQVIFYLLAIVIVVCSILAVTTRRILRAATYLLFVLLSTAGIYFMLDYTFLGSVQIAVYAGGILVLFVFSILLTSHPGESTEEKGITQRILGLIAALAGAAVCAYALLTYKWPAIPQSEVQSINDIGQALIGMEKFQYLLPFEAVSVLLLACIIGAILIARKR
ncbi:MAG: NADH-quinone oxidoreductase subunit J [Bacteroidaceae bacterium]|nr:NADH-quinone oxidoreductase subunit J [Bacteroidales bacterium]MBP3670927.1 NADH-quinone oxidoreductase subunit J [Bacteroidaceae bacterium]MBQ2979410.1 NADH-quinone oxidoreductase subunit J [Bacteroidaceae bacterium]